MNNLAINICILPSKEVNDYCKEIYNQDLSDYSDETLEYIPHITLSMKALSESDLLELESDLQKANLKGFEIKIEELYHNFLLGLKVEKDDNLYQFQNKILSITAKYNNRELSKQSFLLGNHFFEDLFNWVYNYEENLKTVNKSMHITLGKDDNSEKFQDIKKPKYFIFDRIAICQMGNYCSVRKVLKEISLK